MRLGVLGKPVAHKYGYPSLGKPKTKMLIGKNKTNTQKNFSPKPRTEKHSIWVSALVIGMGYLAYLPFQDYGCQVLIRVIRVKNVISFQGYSEQIPLISFLKRTQEGGAG